MKKKEDICGNKYGKLTVISASHQDSRDGFRWHYLLKCDCGNEVTRAKHSLGNSSSCMTGDCIPKPHLSHGMRKSKEYYIWQGIKARCVWVKSRHFKAYGEKGIKMCDRWLNSFENFYADMGPRPSDCHQIDRIDCKGNYSPDNCHWATASQNQKNKLKSHWWIMDGIKYDSAVAIAELKGVRDVSVHRWFKGYTDFRRGTTHPAKPNCILIPKYESS